MTQGLCHRCEYRAQFFETGRRPRYECGDSTSNKYGCYMYRPVKPVVLKADKDDKRPQFGPWFLSSRSYFVRVADEMVLDMKEIKEGNIIYWVFKENLKQGNK